MHGPVLIEMRRRSVRPSGNARWMARAARTAVIADDREDVVEVALDLDERGRIAALRVHRGRADDVGEQDRLLADRELHVGAEVLLAEQVAEVAEAEEPPRPQREIEPQRGL